MATACIRLKLHAVVGQAEVADDRVVEVLDAGWRRMLLRLGSPLPHGIRRSAACSTGAKSVAAASPTDPSSPATVTGGAPME
jgi:hypothetical protein